MSTCFQRFAVSTVLALHLLLVVACTDNAKDSTHNALNDVGITPDIQTSTPDIGIPSFSLRESTSTTSEVMAIDADAVTAYWCLADDSILFLSDTSLIHLRDGTSAALETPTFQILDAVIADDQIIVTDGEFIYVLVDRSFEISPLSGVFAAPIRLKALDSTSFWLSDRTGLYRWRDSAVLRMETGIRFNDPSLAWSRKQAGTDELLIWQGLTADHVRVRDTVLEETTYAFATYPLQVGLNQHGIWSLDEQRLFLLDESTTWQFTDLPDRATGLYTDGQAETLYITTEGTLLQITQFEFSSHPPVTDWTALNVQPDGRLLGLVDGTLLRLATALQVNILGGMNGPMIGETTFLADWGETGELSEITWYLDGQAQPTNGQELTVNPAELNTEQHTLSVEINLTDGRSASTEITFEGPPSWATHIAPIAQERCINCHDLGAQTELVSHLDWIEEYESIQYNVETERMPLTPDKLTSIQVELIRGWMLASFPLGEDE
ncbi:MAG: hypothetical protein ACPGQS_11535 [Bradymonadia bacterium]